MINGSQNMIRKIGNFDIIIYNTALYLAVEKENIEIIKLLLTNDNLDINLGYIFHTFL